MGKIKLLSETLINQIAAGEVVERPSSCVKELIENSIDAGANEIVIEIKNAGKDLIKITDNGCGMDREDAEMALLRHATSKIIAEKDLWNIATMGFRGEAIASIASVSKMILKTKTRDNNAGTEIVCEGGEIKTIQDCGMKDGTQIEVCDLFYNTPAREKYLRKDTTELTNIIATVNTIALAHPEISFRLINNDKIHFDLPKTDDIQRRIADIFGKATMDAMIPIFYGGSDFKINGFIGKPVIARGDSKHQYIFVNRRPIQHHLIAYKVKEAFHSMLMEGKKPVFIMNIEIDPSLIDVNVHPRKTEIRFEDESMVLRTVFGSVNTALDSHNLVPKAYTEASRYMSDKFPQDHAGSSYSGGNYGADFASSSTENFGVDLPEKVGGDFSGNFGGNFNGDFSRLIGREQSSLELGDEKLGMKAVTQVANSYIIAQNNDGLVLVDQHAAHERIRYFELMDQFISQQKRIQPLLVSQDLELTFDEIEILKSNLEIFSGLGFEIEEGPSNTMTIYAVPAMLSSEDINDVVHGVLTDISKEKIPSNVQGKREAVIHYMACRSAIKFGQKLNLPEMDSLIEQMEKIDRPYTCPHGRPTMITLSFDELQRMFGRK